MPSLAPSWKSRPLLPSKPYRTTIPLPPPLCLGSNRFPERSLLAEVAPRLRTLPQLRFGEPVVDPSPASAHADGLTWSGPIGLPLRPIRVVPDLWVGTRRAASPLRGEVRPQKHFCPLQTCSPHSKLSQPPLEAWRAERVHPHLFSVWQLGDALSFPRYSPSFRRQRAACVGTQSVLPCSVRTPCWPPVQHFTLHQTRTRTPRALLRGGGCRCFQAFSKQPSQVCLPLHDTLSLSHFIHEWERLPGVSLWVLRTIRSGYTLQFGENPPPPRRGSTDGSKQRLQGFCSTAIAFLPAIEEIPQSDIEQRFFSRRGTTAWDPFWIYGVLIFPSTKGSSRCWRQKPSCLRSKKGTGLSLST